ncbi:hypothetical protein [Vibrio aquimaris]|uniref:Phage late control gene D protein (GPD) n=1 Tax=Vibrio aquimaris TaxID=2587862 RepID=A0A5P9CS72_9VIBR|nr:hypothetical protein [Vibrio aquimaris]QFT28801.1 Phage late control gene D protein (GPD) [Vibrio aquimaris]
MGLIITFEGKGSDIIEKRLMDWELIDDDGTASDTLVINLDAEGMTNIPESGRNFKVKLDGHYRGQFQIADAEEDYDPAVLTLTLTSGKFTVKDATRLREPKSRTFSNITLAGLVESVMLPHGYEVKVEAQLADIMLSHVSQEQEDDDEFISRIVERHDAISKPIDGLYIVATAGNTKALTGEPLAPIFIDHEEIVSARLTHPSKRVYEGVKANWTTAETGEGGEVEVGEAPFYLLRLGYKSEAEARERANAKLYSFKRKGQALNLDIQGRGDAFAESPLSIRKPKNKRFGAEWSSDTVTHRGDRETFKTTIKATRPKGK